MKSAVHTLEIRKRHCLKNLAVASNTVSSTISIPLLPATRVGSPTAILLLTELTINILNETLPGHAASIYGIIQSFA
jgi:hypothetical protein